MSFQPNKNAQTTFQDYINKSAQAIHSKKFSKAIDWAEKAIKNNPLAATGYHTLAYAHDKNGNREKALHIILTNKSKDKSAGYFLYGGELLTKTGDYEKAIAYFKESLALQPNNNNSRIGLIHIYRKLGNNVLAHLEFLEIKRERELTTHEKSIFLDSFTKVNFHTSPLSVLEDIDNLLNDQNLERRQVSAKAGELLVSAYPDLSSNQLISLTHPILSNPIFLSLIKKMPMANFNIDYLLTNTRKLLLLSIAEVGEISDDRIPLCETLAEQNFLNEYIHYVTDDEQKLLLVFEELLANQLANADWQITDSEAIIVVLLMYYSLDKLPEKIHSQLELSSWPERLKPFATHQLINREIEIQLGSATPSLTEISSSISTSVRAHYEENPYPRWTECNTQRVDTVGQYINNLMPELVLTEEFFNPQMRILVAGCGTGRQAIETAFHYPKAKIVALDLSRRSLGYAQRMARKFGIKNIEFFHGDILELNESLGSFDLIECCGVLHHLAEPMTGWKNLTRLLTAKGIMRIDLYSRLARREIIERKKQISQLQLDSSIGSLRVFRNAVLSQNSDQFLLKLRDFYVTSEFRDLLFHTQETQYTLEEIDQALSELNLQFIAMHIDESKLAVYRQEFPQSSITDLRCWSQFEKQHPTAFIGMYSFWCQNSH